MTIKKEKTGKLMKTSGLNIVDRAIEFAAKVHRDQNRKGTSIPYIIDPYAAGMIPAREVFPKS